MDVNLEFYHLGIIYNSTYFRNYHSEIIITTYSSIRQISIFIEIKFYYNENDCISAFKNMLFDAQYSNILGNVNKYKITCLVLR